MDDTVDILLATYNGKKYLGKQLESILQQTHKELRIVVRDDGSSDGSYALVEAYARNDRRVLLLPSAGRLGVRANFSRLMEHVRSDYILFSDQDDVWKKEKVYMLLSRMKEMERVHGRRMPLLVHSDMQVVDSTLRPIAHSFWRYARLNPYRCRTINKLLIQNTVTGCATLINSPLLEIAAPIPEEAIMHDWWLALVAAAFGRIGIEDSPTVLYRQHGNNTVGAQKFGSWRHLKRGFTYFLRGDSSKNMQAVAFYDRYYSQLNEKQKKLLDIFLSLPNHSYLRSRYLMLRHSILKSGLLRNCALLLARLPKS